MQLGLPSRDYFLHLESEKDLAAYHNYMVDVAGAEFNTRNGLKDTWKTALDSI